MQHFIFSKMEGEELRQTLVSIGISIVLADLMLWWWGGQSYSILAPQFLQGFYDLYEKRIAHYCADPPPANWDGVFEAKTKAG